MAKSDISWEEYEYKALFYLLSLAMTSNVEGIKKSRKSQLFRFSLTVKTIQILPLYSAGESTKFTPSRHSKQERRKERSLLSAMPLFHPQRSIHYSPGHTDIMLNISVGLKQSTFGTRTLSSRMKNLMANKARCSSSRTTSFSRSLPFIFMSFQSIVF